MSEADTAKRPERLPLVYIASNGRSGSTLLDVLLGAHPEVWSTGEFQHLPNELIHEDQPCGCGTPVKECEFWRAVLERTDMAVTKSSIAYFRGGEYRQGRVLRPRELLQWIGHREPDRRPPVDRYGRDNARVLRAVWEVAAERMEQPLRWLVDASKDPYRLRWLAESGLFDLRVIHISKDPKAFVHSMTKELQGMERFRRTVRFSARWVIENLLIRLAARRVLDPTRVLRLDYERLAGDPEGTLKELARWLRITRHPHWIDEFRDVQHGVSGNQARYETRGIRLDERWKSAMPGVHKAVCGALTVPFRRLIRQP